MIFENRYKIDHAPGIVEQTAKNFGLPFTNPILTFDFPVSRGSLEYYHWQEGVSLQISKFKLHQDLRVIRSGTEDPTLTMLDFPIVGSAPLQMNSNFKGSKINTLGLGSYFASSTVQSQAIFKAKEYHEQIHIFINKTWLKDFFSTTNYEIVQKLVDGKNFFLYHQLNGQIFKILKDILDSDRQMAFRDTFLYAKVIELLSFYLNHLNESRGQHNIAIANPADVERLLSLNTYINDHLDTAITVKDLSAFMGISSSKLQLLFHAVYGESVHKHISRIKMSKAAELLATHRYTISEIGYMLGYQNMSYFSKIFKSYNGVLPSIYGKVE